MLIAQWKTDKLRGSLVACWLATVFSSFFNAYLLPITFPLLGHLYLFRLLLPVTAVLYVLWALREREHIWYNTSAIERWSYIFIAIMLAYSVLSLPRAIDFMWTFRRLFNLCFDLCFFFLMLRLCRDKRIFQATLAVCGVALAVLCLLGIYEVFFGGIFNDYYDSWKRFHFFDGIFQFPVVTYGNTNDYSAALLFCSGVALLAAVQNWTRCKKGTQLLIGVGFGLIYFLLLASGARLIQVSFWLLLAGFSVFLLIADRRRLWVPLLALVLVFGVQFANQYRYIIPAVQQYLAELKESTQPASPAEQPAESTTLPHPPASVSLDEEFFIINEETGEKELRDNASAGMRARLLIHAFNCFKESYGLGVGLGNTETLAPQREVVPQWADEPQNSIHCFVARIIGDYGIFALIPLCVIGLLFLKRVWELLQMGASLHNAGIVGIGAFYFFVLCLYPFSSTAPSDAQDIIAMWLYLGAVVLPMDSSSNFGTKSNDD